MKYKDFPLIKPSSQSIGIRRVVYTVGINDADYMVNAWKNGKRYRCPIYIKWTSMLERCYCDKLHKRNPSYVGCTVDERWHSFMAFREWVLAQPEWEGLELDKDLLSFGNKLYGPDTCIFIPAHINTFLIFKQSSNSGLPIGVAKANNKYRFGITGSCIGIRDFKSPVYDTAELAAFYYWEKKLEFAKIIADNQSSPVIASALIKYIEDSKMFYLSN